MDINTVHQQQKDFWKDESMKLKEENKKLKEALKFQKQVSFWRMCEAYNGFHKNTNLRDPEWIGEMNAMIEDRKDTMWCEGTVEELQEGYLEWVGGYETEDEDEEDVDIEKLLKENEDLEKNV